MTRCNPRTKRRYEDFLPAMSAWIDATLELYGSARRPISEFGFRRLPQCFSPELLAHVAVVPVEQIPIPPLSLWGLTEFAPFERQASTGITLRDTYFLNAEDQRNESLHCHELVHVVEWAVLGERDFLLSYALELAECGYADCFLERIAYQHQARFDSGMQPYDIEAEVRKEMTAFTGSGLPGPNG